MGWLKAEMMPKLHDECLSAKIAIPNNKTKKEEGCIFLERFRLLVLAALVVPISGAL